MKFIFCLIAGLFLASCASTPTLNSAHLASSDRLLAYQESQGSSDGTITVIRNPSLSGSSCYYAIYIDNQLAARIDSSEKVFFHVGPGKKILKVTRDPQGKGLCSFGDATAEQIIDLHKNEHRTFRLSLDLAADPSLREELQ